MDFSVCVVGRYVCFWQLWRKFVDAHSRRQTEWNCLNHHDCEIPAFFEMLGPLQVEDPYAFCNVIFLGELSRGDGGWLRRVCRNFPILLASPSRSSWQAILVGCGNFLHVPTQPRHQITGQTEKLTRPIMEGSLRLSSRDFFFPLSLSRRGGEILTRDGCTRVYRRRRRFAPSASVRSYPTVRPAAPPSFQGG